MAISAEIETLADKLRRSGLCVWNPLDPKWPDEIIRGIAIASEAIEKSLDADDQKKYGQLAKIYGAGVTQKGNTIR